MTKQVLALALIAPILFAQSVAPLTDQRVIELTRSGVQTDELIRMIGTAPQVSFDLSPGAEQSMMQAGVSEETIRAMAAREAGAVSAQPIAPVPTSPVQHHHLRKRTWILIAVGAGGLGYLGYRLSNPSAGGPSGCIAFCSSH